MAFAAQYDCGKSNQFTVTLKASAAITKYKGVTIASNSDGECTTVASAGAFCHGICQNTVSAAGDTALICVQGISKVLAGDAVTKGVALQIDATGRAIAATTADEICGWALEAAAAAGDVITMVVGYGGIY